MKYAKILGLAAMALAALMAIAGSASATTITSSAGATPTIHATSEHTTLVAPFGTISCKHSTVHGTVEKHGSGVTAGGKISELTFTVCANGTPTTPVLKAGTLEVHGTSTTGNGTLTSSGAEVIVHNTLVGTCTYSTATATHIGTVTGSNVTKGAAVLDINGAAIRQSGSGFCGESATWSGTYKVLSPATLEIH